MSLKQTVYFMALVGGLAGLLCWFVQAFLSDLTFAQENAWVASLIYTTLLGAFLGGLTVAFADRWTSDKLIFRWVLVGIGLGAAAGMVASLLYSFSPIQSAMIDPDPGSFLALIGRTLAWIFAGTLIGLLTGLRWSSVNKLRAVHAAVGGLFGGLIGGVVFSALGGGGNYAEFWQAFGFMITGVFITLGVTLAPVLLKDGVVQFISSGDARAQNKYGSPRQEWVIQDKDSFVIGSQSADLTQTMYSRDVQIYIPDARVAARHAILFARDKRFYIQAHPDNLGPQGQAEYPIVVGDQAIVGAHELRDGDELILGQTLLRFLTKKSSQAN